MESRYFLNSKRMFPIDVGPVIEDGTRLRFLDSFYTRKYRTSKNGGFAFISEDTLQANIGFSAEICRKINAFCDTLTKYNSDFSRQDGVSSFYITEFRDYISTQGYTTDEITDENIIKLLTYQYDALCKETTGALCGRLLFHSTNRVFDHFDYHHVGENTENPGHNGAGNYFGTHPTVYGSRVGFLYKPGLNQPYMITDISAVYVNDNDKIPDIIGIPHNAVAWKKTKLPELIQNAILIADTKTPKDIAIIDGWGIYKPQIFINEDLPVSEISVARNTGIKSLFPHPSRFIEENGKVTLLPTDWSDIRVNY